MNDPGGLVTRDGRLFEIAVWAGAALVTTGVYAGFVLWMMHVEPVVAADNAPPAAIMIEIADAATAALTEMNEITPEQTNADESVPQAASKQEQKPEETPPEPDKPEPPKEEIIEPQSTPAQKVEVPLPEVHPVREKPKPRNQQRTKQSKAAVPAQVRVQPSDRTAAAQTTSGVSSLTPANWQSQLMAHLERRKRYPAGARARAERGTVYVRFTIDASGNVLSASLARSSGSSELDQEVLSLVRRASPVPAPPPGANRVITAPVRFS